MNQLAPKSMQLHIALTGRTNSGKSSLMNLIAGQDCSIISPLPGTTTDAVETTMELRPLGPVRLLDTAGTGDDTSLGQYRIARTMRVLDRADIMLLVVSSGYFGEPEKQLLSAAKTRGIPVIPVVNKCDAAYPDENFSAMLAGECGNPPLYCAGNGGVPRGEFLPLLKDALLAVCPDDFLNPPHLLGDLLRSGDTAVFIVPIDMQAPRGRLIMPQVQSIRDALDNDAAVMTVRENHYLEALENLRRRPALVVCDSQVLPLMIKNTPADIPCTTFSILMSRIKGDLASLAAGAQAISSLRSGNKVLIAEACTHHAGPADIGRVKIPRLLEKAAGGKLDITVCAGHDFQISGDFSLAVMCGCCMLNRRETLRRIERAAASGVPVTNYGMAIAAASGALDRVLEPFGSVLLRQ